MTTQKNYPEVNPNPEFPKIEEAILTYWQREGIFKASVESRPPVEQGKNNEFIFYDGPPFANGLPHYGHLLTGFVKDLFARYQTMRGKRVERRFGWDCHGLPAEMGAEKDLQISGRQQIMQYDIGKFNEYCRSSVMKYTQEWEYYVTREGRWVDFKNDYKTMDKNYMESVLWAFKQLYDKGLVYEAYRVMPYSWAAETPLSNFETKLDNSYREREDKAITVALELNTPPKHAPQAEKYHVLAWTTTPWTLPSNLALAVGKELYYIPVRHGNSCTFVGAKAYSKYASLLLHDEVTPKTAVLETDRLYLRPFTDSKEDFQLFYNLQADPQIASTTSDGVLPREKIEAEYKRFLAGYKKHGYAPWAVFEKASNKFVGRAGLDERDFTTPETFNQPHIGKTPKGSKEEEVSATYTAKDKVTEIRYTLRPEFWGKEYGTELAVACMDWAFANLGITRLMAGTMEAGGEASTHMLINKLGFTYHKTISYKGNPVLYFSITREEYMVHRAVKGEALLGLSYTPLFPYFASHKHAFRILDGSHFVTDEDGTGIVHMAPGFGEDDQRVCEANGIELVCPVDGQGRYTDEIYDLPGLKLKGLNVIADTRKEEAEPYKKEQLEKYGLANLRIIDYLKKTGALISQSEIKHNYPHCWRTDTPLIYRAISSWYVEVTKFRDRAVELNQQINWIPEHIRDGQMSHMLATAPDWSISRNRFWGTPIPVWRSKSGKIKVFGSIAELEEASGKKIADLHRPYIDDIVITEGGEEFRRVEDVFDCWFESGSMPFAQVHYPFENKEWFETHFPADFITEYVGQTRGWFNTLIMLSTALFDCIPFKNCICHGVVLDSETGLKYSKRLKNYKDPVEVFDKFGADALRWMMLSSPVMRGADLAVDPEGKFIRDVVRLSIKPIWNAYNFFCLYANADGIRANKEIVISDVMDQYILEKCSDAISIVRDALDHYNTPAACDAVLQFFEVLNNWYIRRNKERFWKQELDADKQAAYDTLYAVLVTMCKVTAPLLPFTTEEIYRGLTGEVSVHLSEFPTVIARKVQATATFSEKETSSMSISDRMDQVRDICNAGLAIRNKLNIRVRQPLLSLTVVGAATDMQGYYLKLIEDELNVKKVLLVAGIDEYATTRLSINSAVLGKRLPAKMKEILPASKRGSWKQVGDTVEICGEKLLPGEYTIQLEPKAEYKDRAQALVNNDALVILNTTITPELESEGIARDLVRMIQQARKDAGLNVADRIQLHVEAPDSIAKAMNAHAQYIQEQTLAVDLRKEAAKQATFTVENDMDGERIVIGLSKAA